MARSLVALVMAGLAACGPYASDPSPGPATGTDPTKPTESAAPAPVGSTASGAPDIPTDEPAPGAPVPKAPKLEVVLSGRPIQAFAIGETHVFTLETGVQTRLVATEIAAPHAVKVLIEEDVIDGVRFEGVGASRGRVFVVDTYGAMQSALPNGTDLKSEYVMGASTRVLSAPQTLWLADLPRFVGDDLVFRWFGAQPEKVTPANAQLFPSGTVSDVDVDDDALVYATRGSTMALWHWAPALSGERAGHRRLATLPEEVRSLGIDASRAYVHLAMAKEIRAYDRTTGTSTTILSGTTFDTTPRLRSDGKNLYFLTETALRRCSLAKCSSTMTVLASDLTAARALVVDASHAWIVMVPQGKTGVIARVPK